MVILALVIAILAFLAAVGCASIVADIQKKVYTNEEIPNRLETHTRRLTNLENRLHEAELKVVSLDVRMNEIVKELTKREKGAE